MRRLLLLLLAVVLWLMMKTRSASASPLPPVNLPKAKPSGVPAVDRWAEKIAPYANAAGIDPALALAIVWKESTGDPRAYRSEPRDPSTPADDDASRGLMQLLYATARDLGYAGVPDGLFDPDVNIRLGCVYLAQKMSRYNMNAAAAAAAYNAGSALVCKNGQLVDYKTGAVIYPTKFQNKPIRELPEYREGYFINQAYADKVMSFWGRLKA